MTFRRLAAVALALVTVGALVAGCSSDDDASKSAKKKTTTSTTVPTPTTVTDQDFDKAAATSEALIKDAGTDACKLVKTFSQASNLPLPANPKQTERGVKVIADLFRAATASTPPPSPADAAVLNKAADDLLAEGAAKGWDPKWLTTSPGPTAIADPKVATAFQNYQTEAAKTCPSTTTTAP